MAQGAHLQKVFDRIHEDIYNNLYHEADPSRRFITVETQQSIWKKAEHLVIVARHLELDHDTLKIVEDNLLTTMSILVYIRWNKWERFKDIFVLHQGSNGKRVRNDLRIMHYTFEQLCTKEFFGSRSTAREFVDNRAVFLPLYIDEGSIFEADEKQRLPFINSDQGVQNVIGEGFYGKVTKEVVAALHFRDKSRSSANLKPKAVACKRFHDITDFKQERQNLEFLHNSARQHRQIVTFSAIISIGRTLCVLSPLATMDLHNFLQDGGKDFKDNFTVSAFELTLPSMVREAGHLLDALQFLHDGLYASHNGRVPCCHMDLKPSNILVYENDTSRKSNVGIWKISDFGISSVPQSRPESHAASQHGNSHLQVIPTLNDVLTRTTRTPKVKPEVRFGTWLAPELCRSIGDVDGRKNDMWSFGCVFVQILSRSINGTKGLLALDEQRKRSVILGQSANDTFYRGEPGAYVINPAIQSWIEQLPDQLDGQHTLLLKNCQALLLLMLDVEPTTRISARDASQMFTDIEEQKPIYQRKSRVQTKLPAIVHQENAPMSQSPDTIVVPGLSEMKLDDEDDNEHLTTALQVPQLDLTTAADQSFQRLHGIKRLQSPATESYDDQHESHKHGIAEINRSQGTEFRLRRSNTSPLSQQSGLLDTNNKTGTTQRAKVLGRRLNRVSTEGHTAATFPPVNLESSNLHASLKTLSASLSGTSRKVSRGSSPALSSAAWSERSEQPDPSLFASPTPLRLVLDERPRSLMSGNSLCAGSSRVLTYEVPPNVQHVVFSRSSQVVAFVADNIVVVYVLTNNRSGAKINAVQGSSFMNASVSDKDIFIRTQEDDGGVIRRVLKHHSIARDQAGYLNIKFVTYCDSKYFDGVLSDNDHVLLQGANAVHLLAITTTGIQNNVTLRVQGSTLKCWFSSDGVWAIAWSSQGQDHYIKRWRIQDPTESFRCYHFKNSNGTPIRDIISLDSLNVESPVRYIIWQKNNDLAILQEDISELTQRRSWNLPDLNAVISGPSGASIIYLQRHGQGLVTSTSELSHASIVYEPSEKRFDIKRIGLPTRLQLGLHYNRQYPLVMEPSSDGRIIIFVGHCDGRVEEVALPLTQDAIPGMDQQEYSND